MDKKEIRKDILKRREGMTSEVIASKSQFISEKIKDSNEYKSSNIIATYFPFRNEVSLLSLLDDKTKTFVFPRVVKGSRILEFYAVNSIDEFESGTFGVMEPKTHLQKVEINDIALFLTPGVGFSTECERIGYGGGFYDSTLALRNDKAVTIGVCFEEQLAPAGFSDSWDIKLNTIIYS